MKIELEGKVALITASSQGIGFAIAKAIHRSGASVCICARNPDRVQQAVRELESQHANRVLGLAGDIADPEFLQRLVETCSTHFGSSIDILVNNSGGPPPGEALRMTEEQWAGAINTNLLSVVRLCALVFAGMKEKGWGRIINLTSTAAREPAAGMVLSNVTRAGVAAYSKTLSQEVGSFGITVNTILTGGVLTDRLTSLLQKQIETSGGSIEDRLEQIEQGIPVRHIATPDEFAQAVLFLASPEAGYLTGAAIPLDGGTSKSIF
jgi:3-oxoacyl-[acyl-carrier protein] reductase